MLDPQISVSRHDRPTILERAAGYCMMVGEGSDPIFGVTQEAVVVVHPGAFRGQHRRIGKRAARPVIFIGIVGD
ncbi:MAG: hypothetical protein ABI564_11465, partial [Ideonella sp.]